MLSLPLSLGDSIIRTVHGCAPRRPLGRHPAQTLVIPLLLVAGMLRAPFNPAAGAAFIGTSASLLALKWPSKGMSSWRLEVGLAGHLGLALLSADWYSMEGSLASGALGMTGARVALAAVSAAAVLFSVLELVSRQSSSRPLTAEDLTPLQPFFTHVAEIVDQLAEALERPGDATFAQRAMRRGLACRHQLANLALLARSRPPAEGMGPAVATLWELLDPSTIPFPVDRVRVQRDLGPGELMVKVPVPYLELLFWNLADNAFRACSSRTMGFVGVSAKQLGGNVVITFTDDAGGMTDRESAGAFTPFVGGRQGRLHMGLAASRKIAESYGGSLALSTRAEGGTTVTVVLPAARER